MRLVVFLIAFGGWVGVSSVEAFISNPNPKLHLLTHKFSRNDLLNKVSLSKQESLMPWQHRCLGTSRCNEKRNSNESTSFPPSNNNNQNRRELLETLTFSSFGLLFVTPTQATASPKCDTGVGVGCGDLAEGNEFIQKLQARSAANIDKYKSEVRDGTVGYGKLSSKKFSDQYLRPSFKAVKRSDGTYLMVTPPELKELEQANRIKIEYEVAVDEKGNSYVDYKKGPMLVLIDAVEEKPVEEDKTGEVQEEESQSILQE